MRIASLTPSVTETLLSLGAGDELVAVTHRCSATNAMDIPAVTLDPFGDTNYSPKEVAIFSRMLGHAAQEGILAVDQEALAATRPDLVFMQGTCDLCAPDGEESPAEGNVLTELDPATRVVTVQPHSLGEVLADIRRVGQTVGHAPQAEQLIADLRHRMMAVMRSVTGGGIQRPRVVLLEWVDPPVAGGMWLPELIEAAGGLPVLGTRQAPAVQTPWHDVVNAQPDVLLLAITGFDTEAAAGELALLRKRAEWSDLPAVRDGRVFLLDGERYFHRATPTIIDSHELLASVLHPDRVDGARFADAVRPLTEEQLAQAAPT